MPKFPVFPPETVLARGVDKVDDLSKCLRKAISRLDLRPVRLKRINAILGLEGHLEQLSLADTEARKYSAQTLFGIVKKEGHRLISDADALFHITLVDDIGLTTDRDPRLQWTAFRRKVDKAIRSLGLSGIAVLELQPLLNFAVTGKGKTLMLNAHVLAWGKVSRRKFREAMKNLNASRSWQNVFGAMPIKARRLKGGIDDALRIICYQTKVPYGGKYRFPLSGRVGQYRFRPTLKGFSNTLALRLMEGLSQVSIFDSLFCIGSAKHIRKLWKAELVQWHRRRSKGGSGALGGFDVDKFWQRVRRADGDTQNLPFTII